MAKLTLQIFGFLTILPGILLIVAGLQQRDGTVALVGIALGSGFFLAGAPLLGFARVIGLLEKIERNTRSDSRAG